MGFDEGEADWSREVKTCGGVGRAATGEGMKKKEGLTNRNRWKGLGGKVQFGVRKGVWEREGRAMTTKILELWRS